VGVKPGMTGRLVRKGIRGSVSVYGI